MFYVVMFNENVAKIQPSGHSLNNVRTLYFLSPNTDGQNKTPEQILFTSF